MNTIKRFAVTGITVVALLGLSACGGMSTREKDTAMGAAAGGAAGALLTGGGALGTLGGAAAGALIGNQIGKHDEKND